MADLRNLKDRAAELAARGKVEKAADLYREVLAADPADLASRQRLADVLRRGGAVDAAIAVYRDVADRFARDGQLLKAIAICKTILELEPGHVATQAALAELYGERDRAGGAVPPLARRAPPPPPAAGGETTFSQILEAAGAGCAAGLEEEVLVELEPLEDGDLLVEATEATGATAGLAGGTPPPAARAALPRVPIFSDLSRDAFVALTEGMVLHRLERGTTVLYEGDRGDGFYVVATGALSVSKRDDRGDPVVLAQLGEGDFFGEMALLSGAPRAATVSAVEPSEVLELPARVLLALAGRHPQVATSLARFYRRRLLANAMAVSPLFRPFPKRERKLLMERFRAREVKAGEVVIREGEPSDGLYVVLDGAVDVVTRRSGAQVVVGQLREGDLFGEMSCLRKAPASATVVVQRPGTLLRLPRAAFDELVATYPQILELVAELSEERAGNLDAVLSGHVQWTEDGLVLI